MPDPIKTTSFLAPLTLREDLPRQTASDYWAGPHGEIVKRSLRGVIEYVQHHFSATDHGFMSTVAADTVATRDLPDVAGGPTIGAESINRVTLAALSDRFAWVVPKAASIA